MVTLSGSAGRRLLHMILPRQNVSQFQVVVALFVVAAAYLASAKPAIYSNTFAGQNSNVNITVREPDSYREVQLEFILDVVWEMSKNRERSLKQHIKYFNFRSKIQLDHHVQVRVLRLPISKLQRLGGQRGWPGWCYARRVLCHPPPGLRVRQLRHLRPQGRNSMA